MQLLVIAREGIGVFESDADEGAVLENGGAEVKVVWSCVGVWDEGVKFEKGELRAGEEFGRLGKGGGFDVLELVDDLFDFVVGHVGWWLFAR